MFLNQMKKMFLAPKKDAASVALRGHLDFQIPTETVICGWLASIGDNTARTAKLTIDGTPFEVVCDQFRSDLKVNGINEGIHSFRFNVPVLFADGADHAVHLYDLSTNTCVDQGTTRWTKPRSFSNFDSFIRASLLSPIIRAPFHEDDKRVFAFSECLATTLSERAEAFGNELLISVVMPVLDRADIMRDAIDSVLAQTHVNFELIVVDDGSDDGSLSVAQSVDDARVRVIALDGHRGVSAARNVALEAARGEYVAYLDSDNLWEPRYLSAMLGVFLENPGAAAVYSGQWLYNEGDLTPHAARFAAYNPSLLENKNYIDLNAFMHTAGVYEESGGFDVALKRFVDWEFIVRVSQFGDVYSAPVFLSKYFYSRALNTITGNDQLLHFKVRAVESLTSVKALHGRTNLRGLLKNSTRLSRNVSVIVPSYEALDELKACLAALRNCAYWSQLHVIVVDNASILPVVDFLKKMSLDGDITLVANDFNYGFTHAVNQGLELVPNGNDVFILNNDAVVTGDSISLLQQACFVLPDVGLMAPQQVLPPNTPTATTHVPYADAERCCDVNISAHHDNVLNVPVFHKGDHLELSFAPFFAIYVPRETLQTLPRLDSQFGRHYRSDHTYCECVRHVLKKKIYYLPDAVVHHKLQCATNEFMKEKSETSEFRKMITDNKWESSLMSRFGFRNADWDD